MTFIKSTKLTVVLIQQLQVIIGFADPSSLDSNPGWPLRNLLALVQYRWKVTKVRVLCFREVLGKQDISASKLFTAQLPSYIPVTGIFFCSHSLSYESAYGT